MEWNARLRATLIHLVSSGVIAGLAAALVFWLWFPAPYHRMAGGAGLFVLLTSVDVVMGPLMTLVIFNVKKPKRELRRDLVVVIFLQLGALGYGLQTMFAARPVVLAYEGARFRVVTAVDVLLEELPMAPVGRRALSLTGPVLMDTRDAGSQEKLEAISKALMGYDAGARPSYWREWDGLSRQKALRSAKPIETLLPSHPSAVGTLRTAAENIQLPMDQVGYLPVLTRQSEYVALIDMRSGDLRGFALLDVQ